MQFMCALGQLQVLEKPIERNLPYSAESSRTIHPPPKFGSRGVFFLDLTANKLAEMGSSFKKLSPPSLANY